MELFFGTGNEGKLRELRRLVEGLPVTVITPAGLGGPLPEVVEDGASFRENAEKKARAFALASLRVALADDSGLCVDALDGAPGIFSARWSEPQAPGPLPAGERDRRNNQKLLAELAGRPGARLEFMSGIDVHHNVVRFLWRLVRADGTCGDTSIDFGEVGPDGRLVKIVGFFGPPPALP